MEEDKKEIKVTVEWVLKLQRIVEDLERKVLANKFSVEYRNDVSYLLGFVEAVSDKVKPTLILESTDSDQKEGE